MGDAAIPRKRGESTVPHIEEGSRETMNTPADQDTFNARAQRLYEQGHSMCSCGHQMCFHDSEGRCGQCDCAAAGWETE